MRPLKTFLPLLLAASLAVVAPDQDNLREVLINGDNGRLVAPGDGDALAGAITDLVRDEDARRLLGERARATIVERELTWPGNAKRVVAAVEGLL